jgi:hypothetical protein
MKNGGALQWRRRRGERHVLGDQTETQASTAEITFERHPSYPDYSLLPLSCNIPNAVRGTNPATSDGGARLGKGSHRLGARKGHISRLLALLRLYRVYVVSLKPAER